MANGQTNISGGKALSGTAQPSDVRMGMTYADGKELRDGTLNLTNLTPENIKSGVTIGGVEGALPLFSQKRHRIFTRGGEFIVPDGVTTIDVILIGGSGGGGGGGSALHGYSGNTGYVGDPSKIIIPTYGTLIANGGPAGSGGDGTEGSNYGNGSSGVNGGDGTGGSGGSGGWFGGVHGGYGGDGGRGEIKIESDIPVTPQNKLIVYVGGGGGGGRGGYHSDLVYRACGEKGSTGSFGLVIIFY